MESREVVLSLADGYGSGHHVLNFLEVKHEYLAIENCPIKRKIADHNSCGIRRPVNDIYEVLKWLTENPGEAQKITLLLCGFSCKSLSSQGKRELWDGSSKIFFECVAVLNYIKSLNPSVKFFFENVASMPKECSELISKLIGVKAFKLDAGLVSPQARQRIYWPSWEVNKNILPLLGIDAKSFLDDDGLDLVAFTKSNRGKDEDGNPIVKGRTKNDKKAATLVCGKGCKGQSTMNAVITKKMKFRDLSVQECLNLQGVPFLDMSCVTDAQAYEAIGDAWQFNAVKLILGWQYES